MIYLKRTIYSLSIFFILLASILAFLLTTTPGLYTTIKLANLFLPGKIGIENGIGQLHRHFTFSKLSYIEGTLHIEVTKGTLNWQLAELFHHQLTTALKADTLFIGIKGPTHHILRPPFNLRINTLNIRHVKVKLDDRAQQFTKLAHRASYNHKQWIVNSLQTNYAATHVSVQAKGQPIAPYSTSATLTFAPRTPQSHGLQGNIKLGGDVSLYQWRGHMNGSVHGNIRGTLRNASEIQLEATWDNATWPLYAAIALKSSQGRVAINGTLTDAMISAHTRIDAPVAADWTVSAHLKNKHADVNSLVHFPTGDISGQVVYDKQTRPQFKGKIYSKSLQLHASALPISQIEFKSSFAGNSLQTLSSTLDLTAQYMDHLLRANAHLEQTRLNANVTLGANRMLFTGHLPYQWQMKIAIPQPQLLHPTLVGLQTTIAANTTLRSAQDAELNLTINPGTYQRTQDNAIPTLHFQGGHLAIRLTPKALQAKGNFTIDQHKTVNLALGIPHFRLNELRATKQAIDGQLNVQMNSLEFLHDLNKAVEQIQGQLQMNLTAKGTLQKPIVKGELLLTNGSVFIPKSGLTFSPILAKLQTSNNQWQAQGSITSIGHVLTLKGQGGFYPNVTGQLSIMGDHFPTMKTADYTINLSPQLTIHFKPNAIGINGSVLVPSALLKPLSFSNTVSLSEDVVFVSKDTTATASPFNVTTDILINMGQQVILDVKGLYGFLDGAIHIKQEPKSPMTAIGELTIRDGQYRAYGQDLTIDQGQLSFTGGLSDSPLTHIRAIRKFSKSDSNGANSNQLLDFSAANIDTIDVSSQTTVGVELSGRLNAHKIKLFSIPPTLSQSDILSMLILGKPASQASKAGGQLLLAAISSMNLDSGSKGLQLLEQLKQNLGIDFNVQDNPRYNQANNQAGDNTALVVGKSLSKRVYLSYNIGLLQKDSNLLTLKYLLNKFFSIQVTASDTGSGLDLLYTRGKD